jgi:hypothetical protein
VFDFDDTLFESNTKIIVDSPVSGIKYLSSAEYVNFVPGEHDKLDFSQFRSYPPEAKPITVVVNLLKKIVSAHGLNNIIILTARDNSRPVEQVLQNFKLPPVFVAALGDSTGNAKADYLLMTIDEEGYDSIELYEDNTKNIMIIKNAIVPIIGQKNFVAYNVRKEVDDHSVSRYY